jgi:hypothetical protein
MRIAIYTLGSAKLSKIATEAKEILQELGHEVSIVTESFLSVNSFDFLVLIAEPKGLWGGIAASLPQHLAQVEGLQGKRCLALVQKRGFRPNAALGKFMNALEYEGLFVVQGEVFSDARTASRIGANAPLKRG